MSELLTAAGLAARCGVSRRTVTAWRAAGCPCVCVGAAVAGNGARPRFILARVVAWLEAKNRKGALQ